MIPEFLWHGAEAYGFRGEIWTCARIAQVIDTEVRSGDVAYALARPYSYPLYHLASFWGETLVRLPMNALVGSIVALIAVGLPPVTPLSVLATLLLTTGAVTLKGSLEILVGLTAFWVEDTQPAEWIYSKLVITIGGLLLPLVAHYIINFLQPLKAQDERAWLDSY